MGLEWSFVELTRVMIDKELNFFPAACQLTAFSCVYMPLNVRGFTPTVYALPGYGQIQDEEVEPTNRIVLFYVQPHAHFF